MVNSVTASIHDAWTMLRRTRVRSLLIAMLLTSLAQRSAGEDWLRFRGPNGSAGSDQTNLPLSWSADEKVVWRTPLPGHGASSPITVGGRIFLTCFSGYGFDWTDPGDQESLQIHLVCIARVDGGIVWSKTIEPKLPEADGGDKFLNLHGYASSTPVSDGHAVFVFCGRTGVIAFDMCGL